MHRYRALHEVFAGEVSMVVRSPVEEALVYAVLIYETFNRPYAYRIIERHILFPLGLSKTLGPMQVEAKTPKNDVASVKEGAEKLVNAFRSGLPAAEASVAGWSDAVAKRQWVQLAAIRFAAQEYNIRGIYANEIESVYEELVSEAYPNARLA